MSSYRVFARKYRPQRFEEVVGQEHITRTLQNAIRGSRLAQAYLFVGPRGVGKTSTARILAKALNCQSPGRDRPDNPCGVCDACIEIAEGRNLDVIEIDGASNNSVESIRTLRENAAYAPSRGPYKVYLIDEVHMLTTAAFNALLKTLEEPPEHVKFLFATTEAQKVPATILSRCQRFDLRRLSPELIAGHLCYIAGQEQVELEPAAADAIARGADGALRDAESMFDQVIAFCGTTIRAGDVQAVFGFTPRDRVITLAQALVARDTPAALALVRHQAEEGKDLSRLLADLVGLLRDLLIAKAHPARGVESEESRLAGTVSQEKLLVLLDHFGESEGRMRWAGDKKLQLDVALIKAVHLLEEASLSDVLDVLSALRGGSPLPDLPEVREPKAPAAPSPASVIQPVIQPKAASPKATAFPADTVIPPSGEVPERAAGASAPASEQDPWNSVAMSLASDSPLKFGWLEEGRFLRRSGDTIHVEFPPSMQSRTETTFWERAVKKIEELLTEALGAKTALECSFTGAEPPPEPLPEPAAPRGPVSGAPASQTAPPKPAQAIPEMTPEELEAFRNDPLIKKALELFQAEILTGGRAAGA